MKSFQLFVLAVCMMLAISCKKEQDATIIDPITPVFFKKMTKSVSDYSDGTKEFNAYGYDTEGRLSTYEDDDDISTFDYSKSNKLSVTRKKTSTGVTNLLYNCDLDAKGRVTKIAITYADGRVVGEYQYTYNADGFIIADKGIYPTYSFKSEYEIVGGRVVSAKRYDNDVLTSTAQYTYDNIKANTLLGRHSGFWGTALFGEKMQSLFTEYKVIKTDGKLTWHSKANYEYDAQGYVIKYNVNYPLTGFKETTIFTYQ